MFTSSPLSALRGLALLALATGATVQAACVENGSWDVTNLAFSQRVAWTSDGPKGVQALAFDIGSASGWSAHCSWNHVGDKFFDSQRGTCTIEGEADGLEAPAFGIQWAGQETATVGITQKGLCPGDEGTRFELLATIGLTPVIEDDAFNLEQDHISVPYQASS